MRLKICFHPQGLSGMCLFHIIRIQGTFNSLRITFFLQTILYSFVSSPFVLLFMFCRLTKGFAFVKFTGKRDAENV